MKVNGVTFMELLVVVAIIALLVCASLPHWTNQPAPVVRAQCVEELAQVVRYARIQALLRHRSLSILPLAGDNWAQGVRLQAGEVILREWVWHHPATRLVWHGFRASQQLIVDYDLARLAMNGYFTVEYAGEWLPRIVVTRFGRVS